MVEWDNNKDNPHPNINKTWHSVAPYFEKNIFYNFNDGSNEKNYVLGIETTEKENKEIYANWEKQGIPDVIAGEIDLDKIYKNADMNDYIVGFSNNTNYIRKGILAQEHVIVISVKKDLAEKLGIKKVTPKYIAYKTDLEKIISYFVANFLVWVDEQSQKPKNQTNKKKVNAL